jgi:hypothetical protein
MNRKEANAWVQEAWGKGPPLPWKWNILPNQLKKTREQYLSEVPCKEKQKFMEYFSHSIDPYLFYYDDKYNRKNKIEKVVILFWGHLYVGVAQGHLRFGFKK